MRNEPTSLSLATSGVLASGGLAGNIGVDVLRRFVFTVNYAHQRVDFTSNDMLDAYVPYKRTGLLATRQSDGTFRVIAVQANSPAAKAKVQVGDRLVMINGYPVARLDNAQLAQALQADSVSYLVRSGSDEREVVLALTDLLPPH